MYIHSAYLRMEVDDVVQGQAPPWRLAYYSLAAPISETGTSWLNQPGAHTYHGSDEVNGYSVHVIDEFSFTNMVRLWHQGQVPNNGLALTPVGGDYFITYRSRTGAPPPRLVIECDTSPPPPPPTWTPSPTPTNTPTPTATPAPATVDLEPYSLIVTQGLQDYVNGLRLIQGKRTFVRALVDVDDPANAATPDGNDTEYPSTATLRVRKPNPSSPGGYKTAFLSPVNSAGPYIQLQRQAFREDVNAAFVFVLPNEFTYGTVELRVTVNPDRSLPETNYLYNKLETTVTFHEIANFGQIIYRVGYTDGDGNYQLPNDNRISNILSLTRYALPIRSTAHVRRTLDFGPVAPSLGSVNASIANTNLWNGYSNFLTAYDVVRSYGFLSDGNGRTGGLAFDIPSATASGWTGRTTTQSHEYGHTFGRHHSEDQCGADAGNVGNIFPPGFEDFPYRNNRISPTLYGPETTYGFRQRANGTFQSYPPTDKDIMGYCGPRWMSRFTFNRIFNKLDFVATQPASAPGNTADRLHITGIIDHRGRLTLNPAVLLPNAPDLLPIASGSYAIVLRDGGNNELARYPFTPVAQADSHVHDDGGAETNLYIHQLVPHVTGTAVIEIEHNGRVLGVIAPGAGAPAVKLIYPNGGEIIPNQPLTVKWTASDPDGDSLTYMVQYSRDNGATWELLAQSITNNLVIVPAENMGASDQALFRVWATDGLHTSSDVSNAVFTVANHAPEVKIVAPETAATRLISQTITFVADAYDVDTGSLDDDQLGWYSDLQGFLGNGTELSIATLMAGTHQISLVANDGAGGVSVDVISVIVVADSAQLPTMPDLLGASPGALVIEPAYGVPDAALHLASLYNHSATQWQASASHPWLQLSRTSGTTPHTVAVSVDEAALDSGFYEASVTLTNLNNPADSVTIPVYVTIAPYTLFLPLAVSTP